MVQKTRFVAGLLMLALVLLGSLAVVATPLRAAVGVVFDTGHQTEFFASSMPEYSNLISDLSGQGFDFAEENDGLITEADLAGNHILVIVKPDGGLAPEEIAVVQDFVAAGHGLLVLSDDLPVGATFSINNLLDPYGIEQSSMQTPPGVYNSIGSHAVTAGVSQYSQPNAGGEFILNNTAQSLIRDEGGRTLVAASSMVGRVVAVADEYAFRLESYHEADNSQLMRNIFAWFTDIEEVVAPVPAFEASPRAGESPLSVQFTDNSQGEIDTWQWDFGDGAQSSEANPAHTYEQAGSYLVSLTVTGPGGTATTEKPAYVTVTEVVGEVAAVTPDRPMTSSINIENADPGGNLVISVFVTNNDQSAASYQAILSIDGEPAESKSLAVPAGATQTAVFELAEAKPGSYEVAVEGNRVQFAIPEGPADQAVLSPPDNATRNELGTPAILGISLGGAGAAVAIIFTMKRRRRPASFQDLEAKYRKVLEDLDK